MPHSDEWEQEGATDGAGERVFLLTGESQGQEPEVSSGAGLQAQGTGHGEGMPAGRPPWLFLPESPAVQVQTDEVSFGSVGLLGGRAGGPPWRDCNSRHGGHKGSENGGCKGQSGGGGCRGERGEVPQQGTGVWEGLLLPQNWSPFPAHPQKHFLYPEFGAKPHWGNA